VRPTIPIHSALSSDGFKQRDCGFHDRRRRHSSLGMLTPIEFELNNINTTTQAA
jgi:hypothetical protein